MLRKITVVGEKEETFALGVESTDVKKPRQFWRQQIEDGASRVRVAARCDEAGRFVQHEMELGADVHEPAVYLDVVTIGGFGTEVGANLAVDRDTSGRNQFVAGPARPDACRGQKAVQAHRVR